MKMLKGILWFLEGVIVGFGAIMPGISGGTLCVAFKMYYPIMKVLSSPKYIKNYGLMLLIFLIGGLCGFIGLSSLAAYLLNQNTNIMISLFIGFILGTIPDLYKEAGNQGRTQSSYLLMIISFILMTVILISLKKTSVITINTDFIGYMICGVLWGLSFIIPGLSSSTLLLFFNIYTPMLEGISVLDFNVIIPLSAGLILCILLLSRVINLLYKYYYSLISHMILGIIMATLIMIIPVSFNSFNEVIYCIITLIGGYISAYFLTSMTSHLKA